MLDEFRFSFEAFKQVLTFFKLYLDLLSLCDDGSGCGVSDDTLRSLEVELPLDLKKVLCNVVCFGSTPFLGVLKSEKDLDLFARMLFCRTFLALARTSRR